MQENASVLTIDVEDYFHAEVFAKTAERSQWEAYPSRVIDSTRRLLDLLDACEARATFFILGWVAKRFPGLVKEIVARGHEPACHSYRHGLVFTLDPDEFRKDALRAKDVIEQAAGEQVRGYRAPTYSIVERCLWALEILAEVGFTYDSSIFPVHHDVYGIPHAPRVPFRIETSEGPIVEFPMTTFRIIGSCNLPVGAGGYLRILPFCYTRFGIRRAKAQGVPLIVSIHPWEIDPEQPRIAAKLTSRLRHYTNLDKTYDRLQRLMVSRSFFSFRDSNLADDVPSIGLEWSKAHAAG